MPLSSSLSSSVAVGLCRCGRPAQTDTGSCFLHRERLSCDWAPQGPAPLRHPQPGRGSLMSQGSLATTTSHITKGPDTVCLCHQGPPGAAQHQCSSQEVAGAAPHLWPLAPAVPRALRGFGHAAPAQPQPHSAEPWLCRLPCPGHQELAARTGRALVGSGSRSRGSPGSRGVPQGSAGHRGSALPSAATAGGTERGLGAFAGHGKPSGAWAARKAGAMHGHPAGLEKRQHESLLRCHKAGARLLQLPRGTA